jgi:hypothetical protein
VSGLPESGQTVRPLDLADLALEFLFERRHGPPLFRDLQDLLLNEWIARHLGEFFAFARLVAVLVGLALCHRTIPGLITRVGKAYVSFAGWRQQTCPPRGGNEDDLPSLRYVRVGSRCRPERVIFDIGNGVIPQLLHVYAWTLRHFDNPFG